MTILRDPTILTDQKILRDPKPEAPVLWFTNKYLYPSAVADEPTVLMSDTDPNLVHEPATQTVGAEVEFWNIRHMILFNPTSDRDIFISSMRIVGSYHVYHEYTVPAEVNQYLRHYFTFETSSDLVTFTTVFTHVQEAVDDITSYPFYTWSDIDPYDTEVSLNITIPPKTYLVLRQRGTLTSSDVSLVLALGFVTPNYKLMLNAYWV